MDNRDETPVGSGYPVFPGQPLDLLSMLESAADLANPATAARDLPRLTAEALKIMLGRSDVSVSEKDPRFADVTWRENPFFRRLSQGYRLLEEEAGRMAGAVDGPWERQARARFLANVITAALAPANFLPTNPAAVKRAFETGGMSLLRGGRNMLRDLANGGMPSMVDRRPFPVGEKLACTPGVVVYRDEIFELLQYAPATPQVRARPLLMVPPELNRYYVLDLRPGRSMVEYAVQNGIQTFMMVWRNPRADLGHGRWGLDDYLAAHLRAAEVVRDITRSDTLSWLGLCAGGITTALVLGYLAAAGDPPAASATYIVTMLSSESPNVVGMLDSPAGRSVMNRAAGGGQVIPGRTLRSTFAWLRPNDLVFNYLVSGWLLGEDPSAFDVLAWNDDATGITARLSSDLGRLLVERGGEARLTVLGTPVDLAKVDCDSFHTAGYTDHITPWRACYSSAQLLGGDKEQVVVKSGHIQSFVNPAKTAKYGYWDAPPNGPDPDRWLASAPSREGSWWPRWADWLVPRSGAQKRAPRALGNRKHPPLGPAPGTYVHE